MKKYSKLFLLTIMTFFVSIGITTAKEVTLETIGEEIDKVNNGTDYVYIIGKYAFTQKHALTTQDVMLAARSIEVEDTTGEIDKDKIYGEMTIHRLNRNLDTGKWEISKNYVGNTTLGNDFKINLQYVDYVYVKSDSKVDTDSIVKNATTGESSVLNKDMFTTSFKDTTLTVDINSEKLKTPILKGMGSGVIQALLSMLSNDEIQSIDFTYTAGDGTKVTLTLDKDKLSELDPEAWLEENCEKIFGKKYEELILADLIGKEFTAKLNLAETDKTIYVTEKDETTSAEYTVKFTGTKQKVNTDTLVSNASSSSKLNNGMFKATFESASHTVTTEVVDVSKSIEEGMGSGVIQTLVDVFSNEDVQSIDFVYTSGETKVTLTLDKDKLSELDPEAWLEENCEKIFGKKLEELYTADLIGKTFTAKINLKSYAEKEAVNPEEYTFKFTGKLKEIDTDTLVSSASSSSKLNDDMFIVEFDSDSHTVTTTVKDEKLKAPIKEGMGSGVLQTLVEVFSNDDVQSIDFVYTSGDTEVTLTLDKDKLSELDPEAWLEDNSQTIFGKKYEELTLSDLIDKEFTAAINLKSYAEKVTTNPEKYIFKFTGAKEVVFEKYIDEAINNYQDKTELNKKFKLSKENNIVTVDILDSSTKISEIRGTGIIDEMLIALTEQKGINGFTVKYGKQPDFTFNLKSATAESIESEKERLLTTILDGTEYKNATLDDIDGKTLTVEPILEPQVAILKEGEKKSYTIKFIKEVTISFDAGPLTNPADITNMSATELPTPVISDEEKDYRTFTGWYNDAGKKIESINEVAENTTLIAHYKLNVDKFIEDVVKDLDSTNTTYSQNFDSKFDIKQNESNKNEIEIDLKEVNLPLNELSKTSIPGTIAYVLEKGEIKDITLGFNGGERNFTLPLETTSKEELKQQIITDAKSLFNEKLNDKEETATLDQLEYKDQSFTITIGTSDKTVELVDSKGESINNKTYTFKFNSDFVVVDATDNLGAQKISDALSKNYSKIYIDSDVIEDATITINRDVIIEPIETATGISSIVNAQKTITVSGRPEYAIDIQSGNVKFENLKITGGKYGQLKVGTNAKVTANNIDVSGEIEKSISGDNDDMHAAIVVDGKLTASNITNETEKYEIPTIALVTSYSYPNKDVHGEDEDNGASGNIHQGAEITKTPNNMTKNDKYYIVKKGEDATKSDSIEESYYGSFYYVKNENSQKYFMTMLDRGKNPGGSGFDLFKIYDYNDEIDIKSLGYEKDKSESQDHKNVFEQFKVTQPGSKNSVVKYFSENVKVQEVLQPHITNQAAAEYKAKPTSTLNLQQSNGLEVIGNKLSGTLKTQNNDGKYIIPVTLTSEYFEDNKSTIKVTDPNNVTKTYTYKSGTENGIATVSTVSTMKLELEAIKSSNIKGTNGKVYEIIIDVDGDDTEYEAETYTIDYSGVETLEEKINVAAQNTLNSKSFTVTKDNHINGYTEAFTYEYNSESGLTHLISTKDNVEEYTFSLKYVGKENSKVSVVTRKQTEHEEEKVYINDWEYIHPIQVGRAIQEVTMLTDVMGETYINAIDKVKLADGKAHTYIVTLNRDKYNDWVKKNYLSNSKYSSAEWALDDTVEVEVELDDDEQYIKSIKTSQKSSDNTFNVTFENINSTNIKEPKEFLAEKDKVLTDEDIIDFYNKGINWWEKHTGATVYSE